VARAPSPAQISYEESIGVTIRDRCRK